MAGSVWDAAPWPQAGVGGTPSRGSGVRSRSEGLRRSPSTSSAGAFDSPSVWERDAASRPATSSGPPRSEVANATVERSPLDTEEHGLAVALHSEFVALIPSSQPDAVLVMPLPLSLRRRPNSGLGSGAGSGRRVSGGKGGVLSARRRLVAPAGPLRALRFADAYDGEAAKRPLLLAAAPLEAFVWDVSLPDPGPPVCISGIACPPPTLPALAFDETGGVAAVGGSDDEGKPQMLVFRTGDGVALTRAAVPKLQAAPGRGEEEMGFSCASAVTACGFLRSTMSFVLLAAVHDGGLEGRVLVYDMRVCGRSSECPAKHEVDGVRGAPFLCLAPHRTQDSLFFLGGEDSVHIMQVQESGGSLNCTRSTEVPLGGTSLPCWLTTTGSKGAWGDDEDAANSRARGDGERGGGEGSIFALGAIACRVPSGPASLGLSGTAALAVVAGALHVVWGHRKQAERVASTPAVGGAAVCSLADGTGLMAAYLSAFEGGGEVVRFALNADTRVVDGEEVEQADEDPMAVLFGEPEDDLGDPPICSVLPLGPIPEDSALGRALAPGRTTSRTAPASTGSGRPSQPGGSAGKRAGSAPNRPKAGANQPVTFHKKVKSAGYGPPTEPPRKIGQPRLSAARPGRPDFGPPTPSAGSRPPRPRSASGAPSGRGAAALGGSYTAAGLGPPLQHCPEHTLPAYDGCAVVDLCFTPQASHLVAAGSDRTISAYRLPLSRGRSAAGGPPKPLGLTGHQADIVSLCPSYTDSHSTGGGGGPLLLSAAGDKTVRLWALGGSHAGHDLICFDRLRTNTKPAHRDENPLFDQVQDAQFVCIDGAVVLATGNRMGIYKYELHAQDTSDDIKRLQRLGSYKCMGLLSLPREPGVGQSIASLAVNNTLLSGTAIVASSSRRMYAWDIAAEKVLACVEDSSTHQRPVTCLRLAQPHDGCHSAQSMDVFYSTAMDGTVKLWDLRTMQECRTFEGGHVHSCQRLRSCLTPCMRYLCTPSEDGLVCIYDVRTGGVLGSRRAHRDVAIAVDIHPRSGVLASGGFDGAVHFQKSPPPGKAPKGRPPGGLKERPNREVVGVREVEMDSCI